MIEMNVINDSETAKLSNKKEEKFLYEKVHIDSKNQLIASNDIIDKMKFYLPIAFASHSDANAKNEIIYQRALKFCKENILIHSKNKNIKFEFNNEYKCSYNPTIYDDIEISPNQLTGSFFIKFFMIVKLLFEASLIYQYTYDIGILKYFILVYRTFVIQFEIKNSNSLLNVFTISHLLYSSIHYVIFFLWMLSMWYLINYCNKNQLQISFNNNIIRYSYPNMHNNTNTKCNLFLFSLFIVTYFFIPLYAFSISNLLFINVNSSIKVYFKSTLNICNFIISGIFTSALIFYIIKMTYIIKNNVPLLNPFDENGSDTLFHSEKCPKNCKGNLISLDRRVCWNYTDNGVYRVDKNRPIHPFNVRDKQRKALLKYYKSIFSIPFTLFIFAKGYSFYMRYCYIWFLYTNLTFVLVMKIPFSILFHNYSTSTMNTRYLISYSLSTAISLIRLILDIVFYDKKIFIFKSDTIMNIIVDSIIFSMSTVNLVQHSYIGDYLYESIKTSIDKNSLLYIFEMISFSFIMLTIMLLLFFISLSFSCMSSLFNDIHLEYPSFASINISSIAKAKLRSDIIDYIWKPFWENLFLSHSHFISPPNYKNFVTSNITTAKKLKQFDSFKETINTYSNTTYDRLQKLKKDYDTYIKSEINTFHSEANVLKAESLLRKFLMHHIEGRDAFFDGEAIGKRTTKSFLGRVYINEVPFKVFMIYDDTDEKVEIPRKEWIKLCRMNVNDENVKKIKEIRNQLRCLIGKNVYMVKKGRKSESNKEDMFMMEINNTEEIEAISNNEVKGVLKISTSDCHSDYSHGFNVELITPSNKSISIDSNVSNTLNAVPYDINALLLLNKSLITQSSLYTVSRKYNEWKCKHNLIRYLNEVTLSSWFYELVYDNQEITIYELIYYMTKYEKRKETKEICYIYFNQIYQTFVLWEYLRSGFVIAYWYLYWYHFYQENKNLIRRIYPQNEKCFNPDSPMSICYCVMDQNCFENFVIDIGMHRAFEQEKITELYIQLNINSEESFLVKNKKRKKSVRVNIKEDDMKMKQLTKAISDNVVKFAKKNKNEALIENNIFIQHKNKYNDIYGGLYKSFFDEFYLTKSYLCYIIPTYKFISYIEDSQFSDTKRAESEILFTEYFSQRKIETPDAFFKHLNKNWNVINMYSPEELFALVTQENTLKQRETITNITEQTVNQNEIHNEDIKDITITLPPYFKVNSQFEELPEGFLQKIDSKGRIFYVDTINKKTSFTHPLSNNKYTPNSINQYENEPYEPIYYRKENDSKMRIVYVDHENKTTSWVDPHQCNKFNYFPNIKE